jgi:uncharacterized protein (DUF849 family)
MTYGGNLFGLVEAIITRGGHVSIGLGDHPYNEYGMPTNAELIRRVVDVAQSLRARGGDAGRSLEDPEPTQGLISAGAAPSGRARA